MNHIHLFATESVVICCLQKSVDLDGMEVAAEVQDEERSVSNPTKILLLEISMPCAWELPYVKIRKKCH